jgi:hypothetical protein
MFVSKPYEQTQGKSQMNFLHPRNVDPNVGVRPAIRAAPQPAHRKLTIEFPMLAPGSVAGTIDHP